MKRHYNIFDDINDQTDYQSMDNYHVDDICGCTKWIRLEI